MKLLNKILGIFIIIAISIVSISCTHSSVANTWFENANPPEVKKFEIKGNLKNMPNHLIVISEFMPQRFVFFDSIRTNANGDFVIKGNVKEELITYFQFGEQAGFPLLINNGMQVNIAVEQNSNIFKYEITGANIGANDDLKKMMDIHNTYFGQMMQLQQEAQKADPKTMTEDVVNQMRARYMYLDNARNAEINKFVLNCKNSLVPYIATEVLMQDRQEADITLLENAYNKLNAYNSKSKYTKFLNTRLATEKIGAVGSYAIDIKLPNPKGDSIKLSSLKGKYVLLDFWASWCGPCRRENPNNKVLYEKYKSKGFEIYAVSLDGDKYSWENAIKEDGLTWLHVSDLKKWQCEPARQYKVTGIPATFLLDKDGKIIAKNLRGEELAKKLSEIFDKS